MINNVTLVGRLTKDVELRFTPSGKGVATGTIAVNRSFKNANGEQETDFINIVIWGRAAENTANFTKKGSQIGLTGRIQTRSYDTDNGRRYVTEVVAESVQFLEPKNGQQQNNKNNHSAGPFASGGNIDIDDSDLPF
ncbi:single-stranded DNA-binding protein [Robertmurraya sp. DFI.2.37]|uniref:single-stranded DNA-binding protein n=1 Tax=Robertmurraya sp. DFI.2.37 TaxID=3031819 RepID=UPI001248391A|nr:single-stranded DNA-binding protein [Robertmurraya sp. DFI.2.37]MDF1507639.1 single-stranded DNA-binding protein [Robertmurraya sp. DFI.2.37]